MAGSSRARVRGFARGANGTKKRASQGRNTGRTEWTDHDWPNTVKRDRQRGFNLIHHSLSRFGIPGNWRVPATIPILRADEVGNKHSFHFNFPPKQFLFWAESPFPPEVNREQLVYKTNSHSTSHPHDLELLSRYSNSSPAIRAQRKPISSKLHPDNNLAPLLDSKL